MHISKDKFFLDADIQNNQTAIKRSKLHLFVQIFAEEKLCVFLVVQTFQQDPRHHCSDESIGLKS